MGYTDFTVGKITSILDQLDAEGYDPVVVIDAGAQNLYNQPVLPAPYASEWYAEKGCTYVSIDINGENGSWPWDLSEPPSEQLTEQGLTPWACRQANLFVCAGTKEHVGKDGAFDWESIYNCMLTYHRLTRIGGYQYHENPKTGNWPLHGFSFFSRRFYWELVAHSDYALVECGEHAACGNEVDGWNVWAILKKTGKKFPTLEEFKTFDLHTS